MGKKDIYLSHIWKMPEDMQIYGMAVYFAAGRW